MTKMKKPSDTSRAIAWMLAADGRTQIDAANKFGISQSGISSMKAREDFAIAHCETVPELVEKACGLLASSPFMSAKGMAHLLGVKESDARLILLGIRAKTERVEACRSTPKPTVVDVDARVMAMRDQCAMIAETIGGEYGAHVAAAIRGLT